MDIDVKINSLVFDGPNQLGYAQQYPTTSTVAA